MRSSIWKKGLICLSAVMLLECPVGALPGTAYTAKAEETDDKTDTSNIKSILLIGQDKREGQSRQRSDSMILATLDKELNGLGIGEWTKPHGGYFISFDAMEGCAKAIVAKAKEAGVVMTGAGATYPYGKDPKDSNIRIAPSYPSVEELGKAAEVFVLCVKLVSVEKLLEK